MHIKEVLTNNKSAQQGGVNEQQEHIAQQWGANKQQEHKTTKCRQKQEHQQWGANKQQEHTTIKCQWTTIAHNKKTPTNTKRAQQKTQKTNSNKSTRRLIIKPKQMTLTKQKTLNHTLNSKLSPYL